MLGVAMVRGLLVALLSLLFLIRPVAAQDTGSITGRITGSSGVTLAAAQVYLVDTGIGTLTNETGRFLLLNVPAGTYEIRVELVGHRDGARSIEVRSGEPEVADFVLTPAAIDLDEVVVTGTGRAFEKKKLGNTVATLNASQVANAPISNFSQMLQGREPGVVALTTDGASGAGARIRIRGSNSISMLNEPIVYVDGIRVDNSGDLERGGGTSAGGSRLDDINWEAVERVEVLKGAAAATLYGSEASSGVIQVFTKSGRQGAARMSTRLEYGALETPDRIPLNAGFARSDAQAAALSEVYGETITPFEVFEKDFTRDLLEQGNFGTIAADVIGGGEEIQYFIGGRYGFEDGPLGAQNLGPTRDDLSRIQANASLTLLPREGVTVRVVSAYTDVDYQTFRRGNDTGSPLSTAMASKPELANCSGSAVETGARFGASTPVCTGPGNPTGAPFFGTPRELMQEETLYRTRHFQGSLSAEWRGGPGLSVQGLVGLDQVDERRDAAWPFGWREDGVSGLNIPDRGLRFLNTRVHREITFDAKLGWSSQLGDDISSELVVGGQRFDSDSEFIDDFGAFFPAPGVEVLQAAENFGVSNDFWAKVSLGAYVQEQLGFRDWLYGTVGARFDRTSAFGRDANSAIYPKGSVSAVLSELPSWSIGWLSTFRLRAAVGASGLQPGAFDRSTTFAPVLTPAGSGFEPASLGNPDLAPERSQEIEFGLDGALFQGRLGFDATYWDRTTRDALVLQSYPSAGGFIEPQLTNVGQIDASGWEFQLDGLIVDQPGLAVTVFANAAYMTEKVTSVGGLPVTSASGTYTRYRNVIGEGLAPGALVGARMIPICEGSQTTTCYTPGSTVPFDANRDGAPDTEAEFQTFLTGADAIDLGDPRMGPILYDEDGDQDLYDHVLGKPTPDWQGSVGADLSLGSQLSISTLFEYRAGRYSVTNVGGAFRNANPTIGRNVRRVAEVESELSNPATRTDADGRLDAAMIWANELVSLAPYSGLNLVESGDFVRWRELSLTYRLPAGVTGRAGLDDVTLSLTARNLMLFTSFGGSDPESGVRQRCGGSGESNNPLGCNFNEAIEFYTLPQQRRFAVSVRVVF